jgi:hypothetical protein
MLEDGAGFLENYSQTLEEKTKWPAEKKHRLLKFLKYLFDVSRDSENTVS